VTGVLGAWVRSSLASEWHSRHGVGRHARCADHEAYEEGDQRDEGERHQHRAYRQTQRREVKSLQQVGLCK
jgi:hypothetical protein